jgi:hypothetical protein
VLLFALGCDDTAGCEGETFRSVPGAQPGSTLPPGGAAPASSGAKAAAAGAASPAEALTTAQRALAEKDYETLVASVWPATRDAWLADLLVELAIESTDLGHEPAGPRRDARSDVRALLMKHGAYLTSRPRDVTAGALGKHLVDRVADRAGLYASLLTFADEKRTPLDPARALTGGSEPSASAVPLLRLADRIKAPAALEVPDGGVEPAPVEGPFALFVGAGSAPTVLRFRAENGAYWLDES